MCDVKGEMGKMTRWIARGALALVLLGTLINGWAADSAMSPGDTTPSASPAPCPVTRPNGQQPPPDVHAYGRGAGDYGNEALWTALWLWGEGEIRVPETHVLPDGSYGEMQWSWYRAIPGPLTVTGHRLDAPAPPLQAYGPQGQRLDQPEPTPAGYEVVPTATEFHLTWLVFPTGGCWEITGRARDWSLTFVTLVIPPPSHATPSSAA